MLSDDGSLALRILAGGILHSSIFFYHNLQVYWIAIKCSNFAEGLSKMTLIVPPYASSTTVDTQPLSRIIKFGYSFNL